MLLFFTYLSILYYLLSNFQFFWNSKCRFSWSSYYRDFEKKNKICFLYHFCSEILTKKQHILNLRKKSKKLSDIRFKFCRKKTIEGDFENKIWLHLSTGGKLRRGKKIALSAFCPIKNTPAWIGKNPHTKSTFSQP